LEDGWLDWAVWSEAVFEATDSDFVRDLVDREVKMVRLDAGRHLGLARVVARRP
jgi:hypothetical protein